MAKRKKRRPPRSRGGIAVLIALAALAVVAGCSLLRPGQRPIARPAVTSRPLAAATPVAVVTATPLAASPPPAAAASPVAAPSAIPSPTPAMPASGGAKLAIVIDDCGQWLATERAFVALPIPLTLSVLPDVPYTETIARDAADAGKGVMLHLPMETVSGVDPGKGKVTTAMSDARIAEVVADDLARVPLARGVNNHEGSKASADRRVMDDVAKAIAARGSLFFVDSRTSAASVGQEAAAQAGLATARRDVFLDNVDDVAAVETQLRAAAAIAQHRGSAIAIGHPRQATLDAVRALYPEMQRAGITFVLASELTAR